MKFNPINSDNKDYDDRTTNSGEIAAFPNENTRISDRMLKMTMLKIKMIDYLILKGIMRAMLSNCKSII